jgi:hypothetical protein
LGDDALTAFREQLFARQGVRVCASDDLPWDEEPMIRLLAFLADHLDALEARLAALEAAQPSSSPKAP